MIDIDNITVRFRSPSGPIEALLSFSLHVDRGEYVTVLGPNGSGKSTLVKAVCGMIDLNSGRISILGKHVRPGRFGTDFFGDVGVVFQEPQGQFLMPTVKTEISRVLENLGLKPERQTELLQQVIGQFALGDIIDMKPENLSGGQMQIVNLACALASSPQLLVLDEPTTFLDLHYRRLLLDYLDSLSKNGLTILHITQYPDETLRSQRVCVVDAGRRVATGVPDEVLSDRRLLENHRLNAPRSLVCQKMLGFRCDDLAAQDRFRATITAESHAAQMDFQLEIPSGSPFLSIENLKFHYPDGTFSLEIDDLAFSKGQITAIVGPGGSGKSTLAFLLTGLYKPDSGRLACQGKSYADHSLSQLRRLLGMTWQLPDLTMLGPTVRDDVQFGLDVNGVRNIEIPPLLAHVGLLGFEDRIVDTLSGGEKRKLSLAGVLAADPGFVILDEPAAFLDPFSRLELVKIIQGLVEEGKGILLIGHDLPFISELADRIVGIKDGRVKFDLAAADFFSSVAYCETLGLPPDPMIAFRQKLAEHGIEFPFGSLDPGRIAAHLKSQGSI